MTIRVRARVYLEDTDAGGIVYHATYLRYMERARTELLRAVGIEQSQSFGTGLSFVLHSLDVRFHRPARLDDELETRAALLEARGASLIFSQEVRRTRDDTLHANATVTVACMRLSNGRACRVPSELIERLKSLNKKEPVQ